MRKPTKREDRIASEARRRLIATIERALEADDDVDIGFVTADAESVRFTVEMASDEACYVPFTITVALGYPSAPPTALDPSAVRVESFDPLPKTHARAFYAGGTTTPSACCDTGCTQPPC